MKRLNSLLLMMCMSVFLAFAGTGTSASDAIDFDWAAGNEHPGNNETLWYKVDLTAVPEGDDVLLYLNNLSGSNTATIVAEPFIMLGSLTSLNEATNKQILPERNYAMNLTGSTISALNVSEVYIALQADLPVKFAAEPVEPGEKDLDCLNAPKFNYAGTTQSANTQWYVVDVAEAKNDPTKTVEITMTNMGSAAANVEASVSFDCPSSGLTTYKHTLAAGATQTKTLDRALLDIVSNDEVYVKVVTNQKLSIKAKVVNAEVQTATPISGAINFEMDTEYNLAGGEQWYQIEVADLKDGKKLAELTLSNTSANTANITAEVAVSNPYTSTVKRSINLGANQILVKELARNLVTQIPDANDYVWVKLTTNTNITFSARLKNRIEGNACKDAKLFDWATGAWQNKETTLWYAIPITEAKSDANNANDIELTIENLGTSSATIKASMAFECPCSATTDATRTIAAGATQTKVIERGLYANLASDTIFVGVTTSQNIRIAAKMVPTTATPNDCVEADAVVFNTNTGHKQLASAGKTWYKVDILPILTMRDTVPEIVVTNLGTGTANIVGEVSLDCGGYNAEEENLKIAAGGEYVKAITRDMLESLDPTIQYVYIGVVTDQDINIQVNLKKENEGISCMTGVDFNWATGHNQQAGKTVWYKIGLTEIKNNPGMAAKVGIINKNGKTGKVSANIYFNCDEAPAASYTADLAAGATQEKELEYASIASLKPDTIYLELFTAEDDSVYATTFMGETITPIDACGNAVALEYNKDIVQVAGETWYAVSVKYLQNFTSGDATLTVTNTSAATVELKAEVAFECPVLTPMTDRIITLAPGQKQVNVAERAIIDNLGADSAWVRVTADQDFTFRVDISDKRGESCSAPIIYDWENGNTHPANETLWYYVELDTLRNNPDKDMQLNVKNLTANNVSASAAIFFECGGEEFQSFSYDFVPNEDKYKVIDRNFMEQMGWPQMFIRLEATNGDVHLKAELVDALPTQRDTLTIDSVVCKGFDNFTTYTGLTYVIDKDTTLVDSVRYTYTDGPLTLLGDSIFIYNVRVMHTPYKVSLTKYISTNAPVIVAGKAIDVTATTEALKNEMNNYTSSDSVFAKVTNINWQIWNETIKNYVPLKATDLLDTKTTQVTLRYQFETECESSDTSEPLTYSVDDPLRETKDITGTVCVGTTIAGRLSNVVIEKDTTWNDTVFNLQHDAATLKDSVYTYTYIVWKQPAVPAWGELDAINAQAGLPLDVQTATDKLKDLTGTPAADVLNVNSIVWEQKATDGTYTALTTDPLAYELTELTIRYGLVIDDKCGATTLYGEDKVLTVNPADTTVIPVADTVCVATVYDPQFGEDVTINQDTTWVVFEYLNEKINRYEYSIVVWKQPKVPAWGELTTIVAQAGLALDVTAAEADLQTAVANKADDVLAVNSIVWEQKAADGTYTALATDPLAYELTELTIRFGLVIDDKCGATTLYSLDNVLAVNPADTITEVIMDTVCAGTLYDASHGDDKTINKDEVWTVFEYDAATIYRYDYDIKVYIEPVLATPTINPEAVCGDTLHIKATGDEILQLTEAGLTDLNMTIVNSWWELKQVDGTYAKYNNEVSAPEQTSVIRYAAETSCGTMIYTPEFTLVAQTPTADNYTEYSNIEAINKYDWLLMVNVKALNDKGYTFTEEDVKWYKVVNTVDNIDDVLNGTGDDEYTGKTGYYYTIGESFNGSGDYYAVINIPVTEDAANICGGQMRSQVIVFSGKQAPAKIALKSNILSTGEEVVVYGLGQDEEAVISVIDMMGQILYQTTVSGQSAYTLPGVNRQGCYMVSVTREHKKDALKFVVK